MGSGNLERGIYLGERPHDTLDNAIEIAVWAPPVQQRGPGYYACFRLYLELGAPAFVVLFAFYDGTDASPALNSEDAARSYAQNQGFSDEDEE